MKVVRGDLQGLKGVPKNGLCIGIHRAGTMHKRLADRLNHPLTIWSLRPENEFLAYDPKEFEGKGLSATGNLDEVDGSVIFGVRGAPPQVREEAAKRGLEVVADATCPYVVEQEAAAMKFLEEGLNLVILSDPNHHGATRIEGIAKKMDRPLFIVEKEEDVEKITLMRQEPIGVIVQTTFWEETYKAIMSRILERFSNVHIRNTACIDSLQRLPVVADLAREQDAVVIVGWTEGMAYRMVETAKMYCDKVLMLKHPDDIDPNWFSGLDKVGVVGANETPNWMVETTIEKLRAIP